MDPRTYYQLYQLEAAEREARATRYRLGGKPRLGFHPGNLLARLAARGKPAPQTAPCCLTPCC